jgi:hypothetical protein
MKYIASALAGVIFNIQNAHAKSIFTKKTEIFGNMKAEIQHEITC